MAENGPATKTYELTWQFNPRLITDHLGKNKYSSTVKALRELVANAFDAKASKVNIDIVTNELGEPSSIVVHDNGHGISPEILRTRFREVAANVASDSSPKDRLGKFGVGRLAVHRVGSLSRWTTTANINSHRVRSTFELADEPVPVKVQEDQVTLKEPTGTTIEIFNLRDKDKEKPVAAVIASDLVGHFCGYLLGHPDREIWVQNERVDVTQLVEKRDSETIPPSENLREEVKLDHLLFRRLLDKTRFPFDVIFSGRGRTVATERLEFAPSPSYLALVECPYLDSIVTANRELLVEMDNTFEGIKQAAFNRIEDYRTKLQAERSRTFIERAREQEFYPYRETPKDSVSTAKQAIYDVVLEKVNETANLEGMNKRQQEVVFRLLRRSLENENVLEVLHEVARLSDEDFERFRKLLERTTLDSILKLSSEVTHRLDFLDVLHGLVYGDVKKHLKERTQLHKILEPNCWIFGPEYHLATSDKNFRAIIKKHRKLAKLTDAEDIKLSSVAGVTDIPDLYLASGRDYPFAPKHRHLLVEIKAPSVSLGRQERDQIRRYADTILKSHEFDKENTHWDVFLVSARCTDEIEMDRNQKDSPHGRLWQWESMNVWAFEWSEIITRARDEMLLVREHLKRKSEELSVSKYLADNFPDVLTALNQKLANESSSAQSLQRGF
jgi:Histidine kinase-, DNA gyrase B-, and HSP90-like ATPase